MYIILLFILINFIVSCISDIVIQYFAFKPNANLRLKSLIPYYKYYGKTPSIILAGLTVCTLLIIHLFLFNLVFDVYLPTHSIKLIIYFLISTLIFGYIADYSINNLHIFGNTLNAYYKIKNAYIWGMLAYFFSIMISYVVLGLYLSLINNKKTQQKPKQQT
jgi:hypothetical protein